MKLLWVFSTFAIGGPQRRFATLAGALGPEFEHTVIAMDGCYEAESLIPRGVWYRNVALRVQKGQFVSAGNLGIFNGVLERARPDLLLTSNWGCIEWLLANRGRIPHLHFEDGFGPAERAEKQKRARVLTRRVTFRWLDGLVVPSRLLESTAQRAWGMDAARIHRIDNGIDIAQFKTTRPRDRTGPLVIGTVGALRPEKRIDRLIRVFAALTPASDLHLTIVGDGPERERLMAQVNALDLHERVTFTGAVSDPADALAGMDIFAVTSDTEQAPIAMLEAMAAGLPVFATDVGDIGAMLPSENAGFLAAVEDEDRLIRHAMTLAENAERRIAIGTANAARAASLFSRETMTQRYRALFDATAGRSQISRSIQTGA